MLYVIYEHKFNVKMHGWHGRSRSVTLRIRAKVLWHVWSYDFYDTTLSTEKVRRHMIKCYNIYFCDFIIIIGVGRFRILGGAKV